MSANKYIEPFGDKAIDALAVDWRKLEGLKVSKGRHYNTLTPIQRKGALRTVQLIMQKRCGKIKGRTCANSSVHRDYFPEDEAASPIVSTEGLLMTAMIDTYKKRFVATCDVAGEFLKTKIDDFVLLVLYENEMKSLICANQEYEKFTHINKNGKQVIYLQLIKAMHEFLKIARLFYDDLSSFLMKKGFIINPYDLCVATKEIEEQQSTITWHVDNLKISHKSEAVVRAVISDIESEYGERTVTNRNEHTYCGMNFIFNDNGTLIIEMKSYLQEALDEFPVDTNKKSNTPTATHLFDIGNEKETLNDKKKKIIHSLVAKLLFVSKRGQPDIQVVIAFLTTQVMKPNIDDWKKLQKLLCYIRGMMNLLLTLGVQSFNSIKWWADVSYATHSDMKSHTGATMSFGQGCITNISSKQKINTRSSTAAKLCAANNVMGQILWTNKLRQFGIPDNSIHSISRQSKHDDTGKEQ